MRFDNISRLPRWIHKTYAFLLGYFWGACEICPRNFGGHEWRDINGHVSCKNDRAICPACTRAGLGDEIVIDGQIFGWHPIATRRNSTHDATCGNTNQAP